MTRTRGLFVLTIYFLTTTLTSGIETPTSVTHSNWQYGHEDSWPDLCREGKQQSPIALEKKKALKKNFNVLSFTNYNKIYNASLKNNGHSAEARVAGLITPQVDGGGLPETFFLDHLHFHWQSEHTIDGFRYPLELHLVHYAKSHGNLANALKSNHGVAVFSVLFDLSPDDDTEFVPFLDIMNRLTSNVNKVEHMLNLNIHDFLPRDTAGYFRYDGSLTTPNCTEGLIWTVFLNTIPISENQMRTFQAMQTDEHKALKKNFRVIQKLNNRSIYVKISPLHKSSSVQVDSFFTSTINRIAYIIILVYSYFRW